MHTAYDSSSIFVKNYKYNVQLHARVARQEKASIFFCFAQMSSGSYLVMKFNVEIIRIIIEVG